MTLPAMKMKTKPATRPATTQPPPLRRARNRWPAHGGKRPTLDDLTPLERGPDRQWALKAGISASTMSAYRRRGKKLNNTLKGEARKPAATRSMSIDIVRKLSAAAGITMDQLFERLEAGIYDRKQGSRK